MKKLKTYNESVKDFLKSKVSKEEVIKRVMDEPSFARWDYIMDNQLEDLFTEEELEKYEKELIYVYDSNFNVMYADKNGKLYYAVIVDEKDNTMYIFDDDWNKITGDDYDTIKYVVELFKIRMGD